MAIETSTAALALAKYVLDAVKERGSADVLREHIRLIDRATGPVLEENKKLHERVREVEEANRILEKELRAKTREKDADEFNESAFRVLCLIHDENGEATDERIIQELGMGRAELEMHISRLYAKCFISCPGEGLDDPPGYRIIPDGTAYIIERRRS